MNWCQLAYSWTKAKGFGNDVERYAFVRLPCSLIESQPYSALRWVCLTLHLCQVQSAVLTVPVITPK